MRGFPVGDVDLCIFSPPFSKVPTRSHRTYKRNTQLQPLRSKRWRTSKIGGSPGLWKWEWLRRKNPIGTGFQKEKEPTKSLTLPHPNSFRQGICLHPKQFMPPKLLLSKSICLLFNVHYFHFGHCPNFKTHHHHTDHFNWMLAIPCCDSHALTLTYGLEKGQNGNYIFSSQRSMVRPVGATTAWESLIP